MIKRTLLTIALCLIALYGSTPHAADTRAYYLSPYIGTGTFLDKFRPHGLDQAGAGCIDLRPDPTKAEGYAICAAPLLPADPGIVPVGTSSIATLSTARQDQISTTLGVPVTSTTVEAMLPELLITRARTDGTRWRPLRAARDGKFHILLGEQVYQQTAWLWPYVEDGGVVAEAMNLALAAIAPTLAWAASYAEDWNCADSTTINCDLTWTELGTNWQILTNRLRYTAAGVSWVRADSDLATDDMEVSAKIVTLTLSTATFVTADVIARKDTSGSTTYYAARAINNAGVLTHDIVKLVTGTETQLGSTDTTDWAANETLKIRADGSSISSFINGGASVAPVTDTAIDTKFRGGVASNIGTGGTPIVEWDDWAASDYTATGSRRPPVVFQ